MKRKQLPENLRQVLMVSKYLTLYQVQRKPPGNFIFMDALNNYFKVSINKNIQCSCLPGHNDHCMHTFYVLTKIFKLSESDPLVYQQSYSDDQLQQIFSGKRANKYSKAKQGENKKVDLLNAQIQKIMKKQRQEPKQKQQKKEEIKQTIIINQPIINKVKRQSLAPVSIKQYPKQPKEQISFQEPQLQKGAICSICYQGLQNQTAIIKCPSLCFNYFHSKCLKFWVDYKKKQELLPSCPMCRSQFPQDIVDRIKSAEAGFIRYYQSFEVDCCECKEDIKLKLFRCLLCKESNVCEKCYFGWKHLNHDRYLMKKTKRADWSCPATRTGSSMAKLNVSLKYMKQFKDQQEMKILFGPNYETFLQANLKKQTILEYILECLTSVEKEIHKTYKKLDYQEKDIKCMLCKKGKITEMRRLNCKHFIDQKCLIFLLLNGQRLCPFDKQFFLPVFQALDITIKKK